MRGMRHRKTGLFRKKTTKIADPGPLLLNPQSFADLNRRRHVRSPLRHWLRVVCTMTIFVLPLFSSGFTETVIIR